MGHPLGRDASLSRGRGAACPSEGMKKPPSTWTTVTLGAQSCHLHLNYAPHNSVHVKSSCGKADPLHSRRSGVLPAANATTRFGRIGQPPHIFVGDEDAASILPVGGEVAAADPRVDRLRGPVDAYRGGLDVDQSHRLLSCAYTVTTPRSWARCPSPSLPRSICRGRPKRAGSASPRSASCVPLAP